MDRSDELATRIRHGRRDRGDADRELIPNPGVTVAPHVAQALEERARVRQRVRREPLERLGEVAGEHRRRQLGEEDLARRHSVERDPRPGPVANLHGVR